MTIAITGADGQLGTELCRHLGKDAAALIYPEFDLTNRQSIESALKSIQPKALINTAAYTAVDKAEEDQELCNTVNGQAVSLLASICQEMDITLVQISTDYVFETSQQKQPFVESDIPEEPQGIYAKSKLAGEKFAQQCEKHFVVRTCGLYSMAESGPIRGRNFVDTMLLLGQERDELSIVSDQHCTPTHIPDLVEAIVKLIDTDQYGLYHVTNSGETTWFGFAQEIFKLANKDIKLSPISTEQYNAPAPRPRYSVLDTTKYQELVGSSLPTWQAGLATYVENALAHMA